MDAQILQSAIVAVVLALAAAYLGRRALVAAGVGRRTKGGECAGGCGCSDGH
ncbi:MAG TPA: hypothetical protein VHG28_17645 [Longimicrobiaceae bacterium]|nr:hypothetical protein [Longimicrobiaceae bacterium]